MYGILFLAGVVAGACLMHGVLRQVLLSTVWKIHPPVAVGDEIRVGEHRGTVVALGWRWMQLRTHKGERILIPYTELVRAPVSVMREGEQSEPVEFVVPMPAGITPEVALEAGFQAARVSPYLALDRPLEVALEPSVGAQDRLAVRIRAGVIGAGQRDAFIHLVFTRVRRFVDEQVARDSGGAG